MKQMKLKTTFIIAFLIFTNCLKAQPKQQTIQSSIEKVTVFINGGQVERKAKVALLQGNTELLFTNIAHQIDKQSIQVKGKGDFTILSVTHQSNYLNEQKRHEEISQLTVKKEKLRQRLLLEQSILKVFKNEEAILMQNQDVKGSSSVLKTTDLKEIVDFHRNRLSEVLLKQIEVENNIQVIDSNIQKIDRQLKSLNQTKDFATSEILVTVASKENTEALFELTYFVKDAGWFANYDLRVQDISKPIDLTFKANIIQSTGEDWKNVRLVISNGNPTENGMAPFLQPWYLRSSKVQNNHLNSSTIIVNRPLSALNGNNISGRVLDKTTGVGLYGATIKVMGTTIGTVSDLDGSYSLNVPNDAQSLVFSMLGYQTQMVNVYSNVINVVLQESVLELAEVQVKSLEHKSPNRVKGRIDKNLPLDVIEHYQPTTLTFEIDMPYTILSDGKVYSIEIKKHTLQAAYEYFAVPKIEKEAYLTAMVSDWRDFNLLDGEVNLFFEGAYLGKSILDLRNAGDTLNISLGKDKGIVIERKKLKEFTSKQYFSSSKTENRAYEIAVQNNKSLSVKITILDQFPISSTKEISVERREYQNALLDENTQIITWKFELASKEQKKHQFKYSVKYPKHEFIVLD